MQIHFRLSLSLSLSLGSLGIDRPTLEILLRIAESVTVESRYPVVHILRTAAKERWEDPRSVSWFTAVSITRRPYGSSGIETFLFSPKNDSDRAVLRVFIGIKRILASMRRKPKGSPWSYVATVHYTTATFSRQKRRPPSNSSYRIYIVVSSRCVFVFAGCCSVSFSWWN